MQFACFDLVFDQVVAAVVNYSIYSTHLDLSLFDEVNFIKDVNPIYKVKKLKYRRNYSSFK
jgi:hypothetical protein